MPCRRLIARFGRLALYSGLRRGELWALRWEDVDLDAGVIRVRRAWDVHEGEDRAKERRRDSQSADRLLSCASSCSSSEQKLREWRASRAARARG